MLEQNNGGIGKGAANMAQLFRKMSNGHIVMGGDTDGEGAGETVDQLLEKLAKKGKRVKVLDESTNSLGDGNGKGNGSNANLRQIDESVSENEADDGDVIG
jgi:hypothetical protein